MSNAIVQTTSHGSNGLLFAGWNQDQGKLGHHWRHTQLFFVKPYILHVHTASIGQVNSIGVPYCYWKEFLTQFLCMFCHMSNLQQHLLVSLGPPRFVPPIGNVPVNL